MVIPVPIARLARSRWMPCVALVSGSLLFVLVALALAPKPAEPSEHREFRTGLGVTNTVNGSAGLDREHARSLERPSGFASRAAPPASEPAFADPLVQGFFPSTPPIPLPPPIPEPPPPPEPFAAYDAGLRQ